MKKIKKNGKSETTNRKNEYMRRRIQHMCSHMEKKGIGRGLGRGLGRGVLALHHHEGPIRKGRGRGLLNAYRTPKTIPAEMAKGDVTDEGQTAVSTKVSTHQQSSSDNGDSGSNTAAADRCNKYLIVCYNYTANKDSPGGFEELSAKKGEQLEFLSYHPDNEHWWKAKNEDGEVGYVPSSYVIMKEDEVLPWLEKVSLEKSERERKERLERQQQQNALNHGKGFGPPPKDLKPPSTNKPYVYVSAYNRTGTDSSSQASSTTTPTATNYHCEICCKSFNGPKPYKAHMVSRAHREELELRKSEGDDY